MTKSKELKRLEAKAQRGELNDQERETFHVLHREFMLDLCTNKTENQYRYEWQGEQIAKR